MANNLFVIFKEGVKHEEFDTGPQCSYPVFEVKTSGIGTEESPHETWFLLANQRGCFHWVSSNLCMLKRREPREYFDDRDIRRDRRDHRERAMRL